MRKSSYRTSAILLAVLAAFLLSAASTSAQTSHIIQRLPGDTVIFVQWRGTNALAATARNNHVIQLLSDPAMAPVWLRIAADLQNREQAAGRPAPVLSLPEIISLLENPLAAGFLQMPRGAENTPRAQTTAGIATFMVYDATGKAQLIQKWESATETRGPNPPMVSHYDFGGTSVEVRTYPKGTSYLAMAGNYFLMSDQKPAIEQLIARFGASNALPDSIVQRPQYAEAGKFLQPDAAVVFFGRMPDVRELAPANSGNQQGEKFIQNIHLEKVHAIAGSVSFASAAMRVRGAILGNTQSVGPFDLAGASGSSFRTQAIAGDAPEFSVSRVNFAAAYRLFESAMTAVLPPQQAAGMQALEGAAQGFLGMSIPDTLDLLRGEVASATSYSADGAAQRILAATIQKPEAVLHVLRALLGPAILAEDTDGNATILDVTYRTVDPATGLRRRSFYYVGVAPDMLVLSFRKAPLRQALQQLSAPSSGPVSAESVFAEPQYARMRALLPQQLSGLGVADFSRVPWGPVLANFESRMEQQAQRAAQRSKGSRVPDFSWIKQIDPGVIPRHLHMTISGWWKDSNGVYFDSYLR